MNRRLNGHRRERAEALNGLAGKDLQRPDRRGFLKGGALFFFGLVSGCATLDLERIIPGIENKDKVALSFYDRTPGVRRRYPIILYDERGIRQDFSGHLRRPAYLVGTPGIDYVATVKAPLTEICASAQGVVFATGMNQANGLGVYIFHGLGYISSYTHLRNIFVQRGEVVPRGAIIGSGGGSGTGGGGFSHTHFNLFGPAFTPYLRGVAFEPSRDEDYPWRYPANGGQFAIDHSGQLPYLDNGDFAFDDPFWRAHSEASLHVTRILEESGTGETRALLKSSDLELQLGVDHRVDVKLLFLYESITRGKSPLPLRDNEKIKTKLMEYMRTTPVLTAPIKNDETPELYQIVRSMPLQTWE